MTIEHYLFLAKTQTALSGLVALLCLIRFRSRPTIVHLIGLIFLTSILANCAAFGMIETDTFRKYVNMPHVVYLVVSFALFSRLYFLLFRKKAWMYVLVTIAFAGFAIVNALFIQKASPNSYTNIPHSAVLIIYALFYFYFLMRDLPAQHVHRLPMFWFNSAVLFFHAGAFFLFSFTAYLVNVLKNDMVIYWSFHNLLSIIEHIIILIGVWYDLSSLKWRPSKVQNAGRL